ncbi:Mut7-C RNAse domain-containing protein [Zobellella endophytica]|nr:Mut7-C RNAse domain-containing protein [Zobellella endophytica]
MAERFFADAMLGGLARWLRLLGIDTAFQAGIDDGELVRRARSQRRVVLSRDRGLAWQQPEHDLYLVRAEQTYLQLREVTLVFRLWRQFAPFSRCSCCNQPVQAADADTLHRHLPPGLVGYNTEGWFCPVCRRLYWRGSHVTRMEQMLARLREDLLAEQVSAASLTALEGRGQATRRG